MTLQTDAVSRTVSLARQDAGELGAVSVGALSLTEEGPCRVLVSEGGCMGGVCRQVTRLVAVDVSGQGGETVHDLLVRTEETELHAAFPLGHRGASRTITHCSCRGGSRVELPRPE